MRINPIISINSNVFKVNFKAKNDDSEYVYVPLIWNEEPVDTFQPSNGTYRNEQVSDTNNPQDAGKGGSKFKKLAKGAAGTVGVVTVLPSGIEKVAKTIEQTTANVKDSVNNTFDSVGEMKDHVSAVLRKNKSETNDQTSTTTDIHTNAGETILAGDTPVQDHTDYGDIHNNHDVEPNPDDVDDYDDNTNHNNEDDHMDSFGMFEG